MSRVTIFTLGLVLISTATIAYADEVDGVYRDVPTCDNHGSRVATEELGDPMVFSPTQHIDHVSTFLNEPACVPTDDPNVPNNIVLMTNRTGRIWTDLYYVGDPSTVFSNVDGVGDAGVIPGSDGLAFRIDSVGINRPLISESIAANDIFEPGETWEFIVQDYMSPIGAPDSFFSIGFADASTAVIETSAASIVHFMVPEPTTAALFGLGSIVMLLRRRS